MTAVTLLLLAYSLVLVVPGAAAEPSVLWTERVCGKPRPPFKESHFAAPAITACPPIATNIDAGSNSAAEAKTKQCAVAVCMDGTVSMMDAATGKVVWNRALNAPLRGSPVVVAEKGIVVVTTLLSEVVGLKTADGVVAWRWKSDNPPKGTWVFEPAVAGPAGGTVVVGGRDMDAVVLSVESGTALCSVDSSDGIWGAPLVTRALAGGKPTLLAAKTASCVVLRAELTEACVSAEASGRVPSLSSQWKTDIAPAGLSYKYKPAFWIFGGPVVVGAGSAVAIGANDAAVHIFDAATGRRVHKVPTGLGGISANLELDPRGPPLALGGERLLGVSEKGSVFCVSVPSAEVWTADSTKSATSGKAGMAPVLEWSRSTGLTAIKPKGFVFDPSVGLAFVVGAGPGGKGAGVVAVKAKNVLEADKAGAVRSLATAPACDQPASMSCVDCGNPKDLTRTFVVGCGDGAHVGIRASIDVDFAEIWAGNSAASNPVVATPPETVSGTSVPAAGDTTNIRVVLDLGLPGGSRANVPAPSPSPPPIFAAVPLHGSGPDPILSLIGVVLVVACAVQVVRGRPRRH